MEESVIIIFKPDGMKIKEDILKEFALNRISLSFIGSIILNEERIRELYPHLSDIIIHASVKFFKDEPLDVYITSGLDYYNIIESLKNEIRVKFCGLNVGSFLHASESIEEFNLNHKFISDIIPFQI